MIIGSAANDIDEFNDPRGASAVYGFFGDSPVIGNSQLQVFFPIVVNSLHGVALKPQAKP